MTNQLAVRNEMSLSELGSTLVASRFFADTTQAAQAIVKVLAGAELGLGPIASMTGIYVIQGRISLGANLIAAAIKRTGRYNYRVREISDKNCDIEFFEGGESVGHSTFSLDDAKRAGTKNLDKFPRNMLFARAMSNGARFYCPDVFNGSPVYTPEELGAEVNEEGDVIDVGHTALRNPEPTMIQAAAEMGATVTETAPEMHIFWPKTLTDAIIKDGHAKNEFEARGMLDHSPFAETSDVNHVRGWARTYHAARHADNPATVDEAATIATAKYNEFLAKQK